MHTCPGRSRRWELGAISGGRSASRNNSLKRSSTLMFFLAEVSTNEQPGSVAHIWLHSSVVTVLNVIENARHHRSSRQLIFTIAAKRIQVYENIKRYGRQVPGLATPSNVFLLENAGSNGFYELHHPFWYRVDAQCLSNAQISFFINCYEIGNGNLRR